MRRLVREAHATHPLTGRTMVFTMGFDLLIKYSPCEYTRAALIAVCYFYHIRASSHCPQLVVMTKLDDGAA